MDASYTLPSMTLAYETVPESVIINRAVIILQTSILTKLFFKAKMANCVLSLKSNLDKMTER